MDNVLSEKCKNPKAETDAEHEKTAGQMRQRQASNAQRLVGVHALFRDFHELALPILRQAERVQLQNPFSTINSLISIQSIALLNQIM